MGFATRNQITLRTKDVEELLRQPPTRQGHRTSYDPGAAIEGTVKWKRSKPSAAV